MYFIFTEDDKGRFGYLGDSFYTEVGAKNKAEEYEGTTHIIQAKSLVGAKRKLRDKVVRKKGDLSLLYKNVKNLGGLSE